MLVLPLFLEIGCLFVKLLIFYFLYKYSNATKKNKSLLYLFIILLTGIFTNITLIIYRLGCPPFEFFQPYFFRAILRLENVAYALQVYAMFLFSREFTSIKTKKFPDIFKLFTLFSIVAALYWG